MTSRQLLATLGFLFSAATILSWNLGRVPLFDPDEGRYADIAQTMVQTGDWISPRMNYLKHLHKPPLSSWLVASSFKLFGPSELSARLPSVLLSLLLLTGLIWMGARMFDFRTGFYSAWILLTSALYLVTSRLVTTDMALTFFTFTAMGSAGVLYFSLRNRIFFFYILALSLGFGMLTKGPVAWMITIPAIALFGLWKKRGWGIGWKHWVLGGILFLILSFSWYAAILIQNAGTFNYFVHTQLLGRIISGNMGHRYPIYYFLIVLPLGFLPWSLILPCVVRQQISTRLQDPSMRERLQYLLLWFLIPFILFSFIRTKLATYVVPIFPPLALLVGSFWRALEERVKPPGRLVLTCLWIFAVFFLGLAAAGLVFIEVRPHFVAGIKPGDILLGLLLCLAASAVLITLLLKRKFRRIFPAQVGVMALTVLISLSVLPYLEFKHADGFVRKIQELRRPGDRVLMFVHYSPSLPFYLRERVLMVGMPADTIFETPEEIKGHVFPNWESITQFITEKQRVFVLTNEEGLQRVRSLTQAPIYVLLERDGKILFSNRL